MKLWLLWNSRWSCPAIRVAHRMWRELFQWWQSLACRRWGTLPIIGGSCPLWRAIDWCQSLTLKRMIYNVIIMWLIQWNKPVDLILLFYYIGVTQYMNLWQALILLLVTCLIDSGPNDKTQNMWNSISIFQEIKVLHKYKY